METMAEEKGSNELEFPNKPLSNREHTLFRAKPFIRNFIYTTNIFDMST